MRLPSPLLALALLLAGCASMRAPHPPVAEAAPPAPANAIPGAASAPAPVAAAPPPAAAMPPPPAAEPVAAHPALWRIARGGTVIWLFGTIHALPEGVDWEDQRVADAEAQAQGLMLETVLDRTPEHAAALLFGLGKAPGLPPLLDRVAPDKRGALQAMVTRSGAPVALLDGLKTWTAALMLVAVPLADMKLSPTNGVEPRLEAVFKAAGKPIAGLETPAEQLGFFDHLSEPAQRDFLETLLEAPEAMNREFADMLTAWEAGDEARIAATFDEDIKASPELKAALVTRRNAAWAERIAARLDKPGTLFIAVGAGHLAGAGSVIDLLKAKGIVAERVR